MAFFRKIKIYGPIILIGLFFSFNYSEAKFDTLFRESDSLNTAKIWALSSTATVGTVTAFTILSKQWYGGYSKVPFHFFNDNSDWLQVDKIGHSLSAYYGGYYGYNGLKWTGLNEKKAIWIGGSYGFSFLLLTEIMDGFSPQWGASTGDLVANGLGALGFISQQLFFEKQIIVPKFSYWHSDYAQYRPSLLGDNNWNRWLKDYNGQTYWLSFSLTDVGLERTKLPKWLAISVGYGGDGMLGGSSNPEFNEEGVELPSFKRSREFFLSLDLNLQNIKTKSHFLNSFLRGISFFKFPFPTLGYSDGSFKAYALKL